MVRRTRKDNSTDTLVADENAPSTEENTMTDATLEADLDAVEVEDTAPPVEEITEEVVEDVSEADAEDAEAAGAKKDKKADEPVDLTAFLAAVAAAVEVHDNDTGTFPDESVIEPVTAEYRKLTGVKAKGAAKREVDDLMKAGMADMNIGLARAYMVLSDNLTAGKPEKVEKAPADPTEAHVQRVASLTLAYDLVKAATPDDIAEDWADRVEALLPEASTQAAEYGAWLDREPVEEGVEDAPEPEVPAWVKAAVKLSRGKSAKVTGGTTRVKGEGGGGASTGDGVRRDIGEHIRQAFEGVESGTFLTIAQIRSHQGTEYPHDNPPSAGAISARLFPKGDKVCSLDFITPGTSSDGKANKGATKN